MYLKKGWLPILLIKKIEQFSTHLKRIQLDIKWRRNVWISKLHTKISILKLVDFLNFLNKLFLRHFWVKTLQESQKSFFLSFNFLFYSWVVSQFHFYTSRKVSLSERKKLYKARCRGWMEPLFFKKRLPH